MTSQKRLRTVGDDYLNGDNDNDMAQTPDLAIERDTQCHEKEPQTYANAAMKISKPRDVRVEKKKNLEERGKIKILPPTADIPFTQVTFDEDLHNLMKNPWENTILIKVLGKPWYYPTLVSKLESLWSLQGHFFELVDLGHSCYCLKGLIEEKRTMILTEGPWQLAGNFLTIRVNGSQISVRILIRWKQQSRG